MVDELTVETLLAAIGPGRILSGKPSLHKYQLERAAMTPQDIRRRVARFLGSPDWAEAPEIQPFDYREVLDQVSQAPDGEEGPTLTPEQARALFAAVPDREMATDLAVAMTRILAWASKALPREQETTITGTHVEDPDPHTLADFRRVWQIAVDPVSALDDLAAGMLSDDQVALLGQLYPAIHQTMKQAVSDAIPQLVARRGKGWEPLPLKADQVGILTQQPMAFDAELAGIVQATYAPPPPPQAPKQPPDLTDAKAMQTPGERAQNG